MSGNKYSHNTNTSEVCPTHNSERVTYSSITIVRVCDEYITLEELFYSSQCFFYRPQRSWGKVMFLQASVILLTGGGGVCLSACWDTPPGADMPPVADPPWEQTPPQEQTPPPPSRHPLEQTHRPNPHPPSEHAGEILSMRGWYASYRNAILFTGRNKVVAKVIFLHLSVILFTGGVSASVHAGMPTPPPGADTPSREQTPPTREQTPPSGKQTLAYGLRAAGTHPTGMHSCFCFVLRQHTRSKELVCPFFPNKKSVDFLAKDGNLCSFKVHLY